MIKKILYRKILVASSLLLVLFMLYLIPSNEEVKFTKSDFEYVYPNDLRVIYLLDSNNYVSRTMISVSNKEEDKIIYDLIEGLTIGSKYEDKIQNGFRGIIPSSTYVNDIKMEDDLLMVDFSSGLLDVDKNYEEEMIESIIYTLTSIEGINRVSLSVEGKKLSNLPYSNKILPEFLDRSYGINKEYDLVSTSKIDSYIIYYVSSVNDTNYYVPVTKYINDNNRDKIKVIIDELRASYIMESNLSSYLNSNVKLLDYEIDNESIKLNFSNSIFSDINSNSILEEVIYTISLSVMDNVDVNKVIFMVDNNLVCETSNIN